MGKMKNEKYISEEELISEFEEVYGHKTLIDEIKLDMLKGMMK
jgi:hypothetical protein